jgi:hypothetical protein
MSLHKFTFFQVLNSCASLQALAEARHAHEKVIEIGCVTNFFVGSSLISMYAKCSRMEYAWRAFTKVPSHNVCWTAMMLGYVKCGQGWEALELFR